MVSILLIVKRYEERGAEGMFLRVVLQKKQPFRNLFKNYTGFINCISLEGKVNSVGETPAVHTALHGLNFLVLYRLVATTKY